MPRLRPPPGPHQTALDVARGYAAKGWNPLPIAFRSKIPPDTAWQERIIGPEDVGRFFNGTPMNIGVQLGPTSGGLVDLDLDCDEAIIIAPAILPPTRAIFGRASARGSHRLYYSATLAATIGKSTLKLTDPTRTGDTAALLEVRVGPGAQSVFPGSTHKDTGELIAWEDDGDPAPAGDDMVKRAKLAAALCLLARYWPGDGGRHDAALTIGGILARSGLPLAMVKLCTEFVARAAHDEEVRDRVTAAADCKLTYDKGGKTRGYPALKDLFGDKVAERVAEWLDYDGARDELPDAAEPAELEIWDASEDDAPIPPRGWLLGNVFCRRFISSIVAEGGTGKSALRLVQMLALATGRALSGEHVFMRCRVLIVSLEDDASELRRRVKAACLHHDVAPAELRGWLFLASLRASDGKLMIPDAHGRPVVGALAAKLQQAVAGRRVDIVCLDPFVKSHSMLENDNSAIDGVMQVLADMAKAYDIAVDVPHHAAKGSPDPGNANRGRGASSMKDAARLVYTLTPMSPEEGQTLGIVEAERRRLIRIDSAKVNIAPPMAEARWFRLVGVRIGNESDQYPNGDEVQTVEPWTPPELFAGLSNVTLNEILTEIDAGLADGTRYSDGPHVTDRAAWRVIIKHCPTTSEAAARKIVRLWLLSGLLIRKTYDNKLTRKEATGLWVDPIKRPS